MRCWCLKARIDACWSNAQRKVEERAACSGLVYECPQLRKKDCRS